MRAHVTADFEDANGRKFRMRPNGALSIKMPGRWTAEVTDRGIRACNARINKSIVSCMYDELATMAAQEIEGAREALEHIHEAALSLKAHIERKVAMLNLKAEMAAA
jgi:hypothetical protein